MKVAILSVLFCGCTSGTAPPSSDLHPAWDLPGPADLTSVEFLADKGPPTDKEPSIRDRTNNLDHITRWVARPIGRGYERALSCDVDGSGSLLIAGDFTETITFGTDILSSKGNFDIFISKLSNKGVFSWAKSAGSPLNDTGMSIGLNSGANAYLAGYVGPGGQFGKQQTGGTAKRNFFLQKMDSKGGFGKLYSPGKVSGISKGNDVVLLSSGGGFVGGEFMGDLEFESHKLKAAGNSDVFVARFDALGTIVWAESIGGVGNEDGAGLGVDTKGNCYIAFGVNGSSSINISSETTSIPFGTHGILVVKLSPNGKYLWSTQLNGLLSTAAGIAVTPNGSCRLAGHHHGLAESFGNIKFPPTKGGFDVFVASIDSTGSPEWLVTAGGKGHDLPWGINLDQNLNTYVTGKYSDTAIFGSRTFSSASGTNDIFVSKLNKAGKFLWTISEGSYGNETGGCIAIDGAGDIFIAGGFGDALKIGPFSFAANGGADIFAWKFSPPP